MKKIVLACVCILLSFAVLLPCAGCDKQSESSKTSSGDDAVKHEIKGEVVKEASLASKQEKLELYQKIVDGETKWLASIQLSNGALPMTYNPSATLTVNPYFSDFAALALLENDEYYSNVKAYCEWHFEHLNTAQTDHNGLDGTIYDHTVRLDNGVLVEERITENNGKKHYDSVDSYAATFLCVLQKYSLKSGDAAYIKSREKDIKRVLSALLATFDGKLTTTKPDYKIQYLMDNCEVYEGLVAALELYKGALADSADADKLCTDLENYIKLLKEGIDELLWNEAGGYYETAISPSGSVAYKFTWDNFYPCATSQLFMISSRILSPEDNRARLLYKTFNDNFCKGEKKADWEKISMPDSFFWGSIVYAAAIMGDEGRVESYMQVYQKAMKTHSYPLYNADAARVCLAAAVMIEKIQ